MSDWIMHRWHGPPEVAMNALRALGWYGPGEQPAGALAPEIGGFMPPPGEPPRELDGTAYVAVVATAPLALPPGLSVTGPDLSTALLGSF